MGDAIWVLGLINSIAINQINSSIIPYRQGIKKHHYECENIPTSRPLKYILYSIYLTKGYDNADDFY